MGQTFPLGWIEPAARTRDQHDAHARAVARHVAFALAPTDVPKGTKVMLTDFWKEPRVVADVGMEFTGFHQLTGSCVGCSAGNAVFTLGAIQRTLADSPTRAFIPWWPFPYGRTRYNEGDRGQGEGAIDSVMGQTLIREGCFGVQEITGEPPFDTSDGLALTERQELAYSDGAYSGNTQYLSLAKTHPVGAAATVSDVAGIKAAILNGYPVLDGCEYFIGRGSLSGDVALGTYDGQGGHSTCLAADTKVSLLDGSECPIKDLADSGRKVWVYSYDRRAGKVVPKKARARMTRASVPEGMVRVVLDNGQSVTTTLDHKFMLRDGGWREAKDLRAGDSLMPLYRKLSATKRHAGYEMVLDNGSGEWELTHRRVAECVSLRSYRFRDGRLVAGTMPEGSRPVIHHVNFDKRNNLPVNLARMVNREHWRYHTHVSNGLWERMDPKVAEARKLKAAKLLKKRWTDPEYRAMMRGLSVNSFKKMWATICADPVLYTAFIEQGASRLRRCWADPVWRAEKIRHTRAMMSTPEVRARLTEINRRKAKDPEFLNRLSVGCKRGWQDPVAKAARVEAIKQVHQTPGYRDAQSMAQKKSWTDPAIRRKRSEAIKRSWLKRRRNGQPSNHKVASVNFLPTEQGPVYCLEVQGTHNFAVSAGVFVHNCYLGYWEHPTLGPLYLYSNQWPDSVYPRDGSGRGRCTVWVKESDAANLFQLGGDNGETVALSHLNYFSSQPELLDHLI